MAKFLLLLQDSLVIEEPALKSDEQPVKINLQKYLVRYTLLFFKSLNFWFNFIKAAVWRQLGQTWRVPSSGRKQNQRVESVSASPGIWRQVHRVVFVLVAGLVPGDTAGESVGRLEARWFDFGLQYKPTRSEVVFDRLAYGMWVPTAFIIKWISLFLGFCLSFD